MYGKSMVTFSFPICFPICLLVWTNLAKLSTFENQLPLSCLPRPRTRYPVGGCLINSIGSRVKATFYWASNIETTMMYLNTNYLLQSINFKYGAITMLTTSIVWDFSSILALIGNFAKLRLNFVQHFLLFSEPFEMSILKLNSSTVEIWIWTG